MRKSNFFTVTVMAAVFLLGVSSVIFSGCKTPQIEGEPNGAAVSDPDSVETYVNTTPSKIDGKISTITVFNSITKLTAIHMKSRWRAEIPESNYSYNPKTTVLDVNLPAGFPYKRYELVYHIIGKAKKPAVFVLAGYDEQRGEPGVFFDAKTAVEGKDYTFDPATKTLTCIRKIDADTDSYQICWPTAKGSVNFSNHLEKNDDAYRRLYIEWLKRVKS